jgi:hypothetical protein
METRYFTIAASLLAASLVLAPALRSAEERFVIVQPGYPGTTEEATTFVADLSKAIAAGGGPKDLGGVYYNSAPEALKAIAGRPPSFGIVSLGFYLEHRKDLRLQPILSSKPLERFYLVTKKGQPVAPKDLAGQVVEGTAFLEKDFVARVLFGPGAGGEPTGSDGKAGKDASAKEAKSDRKTGKEASATEAKGAGPGGSPLADISTWKAEPTAGSTKPLRDVSKGKARAALVTGFEKRAMKDLTVGKELEVSYQTEEYPTALVVSFGEASAAVQGSAKALEGLQGTAEGKDVVKMMGIEGFAPVDAKRLAVIEARWAAGGKDGGRDAGTGTGR